MKPAQGTWSEECEGLLSEHGGLELGRLCRADGLWLKVCAEYRASVILPWGPPWSGSSLSGADTCTCRTGCRPFGVPGLPAPSATSL